MLIVIDAAYRATSEGRFLNHTVRFFSREIEDRARLAEVIRDADVIGLRRVAPALFDRELLDHAPNLRFIHKSGTGTDSLDIEVLTERGILLANNAGINAGAVAEMTLLLTLLCLRNPRGAMDRLRVGEWWREQTDPPPVMVHGKTVGIVGMGAIGQRVAQLMTALGAEVLAYRRPGIAPSLDMPNVTWVDLPDLLATSDVVSLHVPLTDQTRGLIGTAELAAMKPTAVLINTARGAVVDESALYTALTTGKLRAAGLDVFAQEPASPDNPLLRLNNVYASPHIAGATAETLPQQLEGTVANIERYVAGLLPERLVNPEVLSSPMNERR